MIVEALEHLDQLARQAAIPTIVNAGKGWQHHYHISYAGHLERIDFPPEPRRIEAYSLSAFAKLVRHYAPPGCPVFVGRGAATAIMDDEPDAYRDQRITLNLQTSAEFSILQRLRTARTPHRQAEFINLLRVDLAGCVSPDLIASLRQLRQSTTGDTEGEVKQGRESLGRAVMAQVSTKTGELPEDVDVTVNVYETEPESSAVIACVLAVNPTDLTFALIPKAGQLEAAEQHADESIAQTLAASLAEHKALVFLGTP